MGLENILTALRHSMSDNFSDLNEELLQDNEVRQALTTYFAEQETRPELVSLVRAPSLMLEYLQLNLDEREELEGFRKASKYYLQGGGEVELNLKKIESEKVIKIIRMQRYTSQLLELFNFYLDNRKENEVFNPFYLKKNQKIRNKYKSRGENLCACASRYFKTTERNAFNRIINLLSEINPEIENYTDPKKLFRIDGANRLLKIFDFYLANRESEEVFCSNYLINNKKLKSRFNRDSYNLYMYAKRFLEGGFNKLIKIVAEINPKVGVYSDKKEVLKLDFLHQLEKLFEFYHKNRKEADKFNTRYLQTNKKLREEFGCMGMNLYVKIMRHFKEEGGINYFVKLIAQQRPDISKYWQQQIKRRTLT